MWSRRARTEIDGELATILAGPPPGTLGMTGGFPNPATFARELLVEIAARLVRDEPGIALQYTPSEGLPSVREYLLDRVESLQGRRPVWEELGVTSGGMECIDLVSRTLLDPGDAVVVEAPTYLGAIMAFARYQAKLTGIPMDEDGMQVELLEERLQAGFKPKFVYIIPEYQNPSGRTLSLERRHALIETCRRHGVLIFEDVAYRELAFGGDSLPSLWSLGPDVVLQAGTFSKVFCPGVRLGWATGPAELVAELAIAKQNTDQCAGALGQRLFEEYARRGWIEEQLGRSRALYGRKCARMLAALERTMPTRVRWTTPRGGFFSWVTLPDGGDAALLAKRAVEAGVGIVPGSLFFPDGRGGDNVRLSFSLVDESAIDGGIARLAELV